MKKFLVLFLMLVLCLGAMTSTASAREKIEFCFHAANETSNAEYEKLFGILNEIQDEYEFVYTGFASSNFADSLNMAIATQTMPDVISTGFSNTVSYTHLGAYPVAQIGGAPACGFFAPRSHDLVPLPENGCAIQGEDSAKATQAVLTWMRQHNVPAYDELTGRGLVRHIMTRSTTSGELMVVVVVTRADIPKADRLVELLRAVVPGLCSVCLSVNSRRTVSYTHLDVYKRQQ